MDYSWILKCLLSTVRNCFSGSGFRLFFQHALLILAFLFSDFALGMHVMHEIPKLLAPIEFDGKIETGEWDAVDTLSFISHWPEFSEKPNSRTLFRVTYDEKFLYFSALCFDQPNLIQGPNFERDNWEMTMDHVAIIMDTYNDNENGVIFVVTPTSSRIDVSLKNDTQGPEPVDLSWNSFWEALVSRHQEGWSIEARIPFSSLRFQSSEGNVTMGLIAYRYIARGTADGYISKYSTGVGVLEFHKAINGQRRIFFQCKQQAALVHISIFPCRGRISPRQN